MALVELNVGGREWSGETQNFLPPPRCLIPVSPLSGSGCSTEPPGASRVYYSYSLDMGCIFTYLIQMPTI